MKSGYGNFVKMLIGICLLVIGVALVLSFFEDVVGILRGVIGPGLALAGLLVLYSLNIGSK